MNRDRGSDHRNKEVVDTVKALIEVYKSAFGDGWQNAWMSTVRLSDHDLQIRKDR
jgi:hypothetical protein